MSKRFGGYIPYCKTFEATVLPSPQALEGRYGYQSFATGGGWRQEARGEVSVSTSFLIAMHLAGAVVLAVPLEGLVRYVEIDLDAKTPATAATLHERTLQIARVFERNGQPGGVTWGSSANGGVHYRITFDVAHDAGLLRERTLELLARAGIQERPGLVEVYPNGARVLRLPLGAGSSLCDEAGMLLRDKTGKHVGGRVTRTGTFRRNVREMIENWERSVNERRTTTAAIFGLAPVFSLPTAVPRPAGPCSTRYVQFNVGGASTASSSRGGTWRERMDHILANGAPEGGRFDAAGAVLFDLRVVQGLTPVVTLKKFGDWLRGPQGSKDLRGPRREQVIRRMEREAGQEVARLNSGLAAGALTTQRGRRRSAQHPYPLLSTLDERDTNGKAWRKTVIAGVSPSLTAVLATVKNVRLRGALGVLAGLLERYRRQNPTATKVPISAGVFKTIMGGGRVKWTLEDDTRAAPYRAMIEQAQLLGILGRIHADHSREKHTATIFRLP